MKANLSEPSTIAPFRLGLDDHLTFLGSCFSDEMGILAADHGFNVFSNPFGTIFHPLPIARNIKNTLSELPVGRLFCRDDIWLSWDASEKLHAESEDELIGKMCQKQSELVLQLTKNGCLFVTFGSAWGYVHHESGEVVANCHRMPQQLFRKELFRAEKLIEDWFELGQNLRRQFPNLKFCFTVSPIRHVRDGLVENQRSKAVLIEMVHELTRALDACYLPVYELVMDVYRDSRYFEKDLIHPNGLLIDRIWQYTLSHLFDERSQHFAKEMHRFRSLWHHKPLISVGKDAGKWLQKREEEKAKLIASYPSKSHWIHLITS